MKNELDILTDQNWIVEADDKKITFCGVLVEHWREVKGKWNDKTAHAYVADYINRIVPNLKGKGELFIGEYTADDYEAVIEKIIEEKKKNEGKEYKPYQVETLHVFRRLIERVVEVAEFHNYSTNVLWGTIFDDFEEEEKSQKSSISKEPQELTVLKRSFTKDEEQRIVRDVMTDPLQVGQKMGVFLMFWLGLRNGECCTVKYGDFIPMKYHADCVELYVYDSKKAGSKQDQAGGKTSNAGRIIPLPTECWEFIKKALSQ